MDTLIKEKLNHSMEYGDYRTMIDQLLEKNQTTGTNHSESMLHYTVMNVRRMNRLEKTVKLQESTLSTIDNLQRFYTWLVITEAWCGDAAQILPVLQAMADHTEHIEMRVILRDEHPELMDQFLSNGSRSIPKLISIEQESGEVVGSWGPRPEPAQELLLAYKADPKVPYQEFNKNLQQWYNKDKSRKIQEEVGEEIRKWE